MKLETKNLSKKEITYTTLYAERFAAYVIKKAGTIKGKGCEGFWFYGGTARGMGLPNDEEAAHMGDALRKAVATHLETLGIYLQAMWDDEDGGWGIRVSKTPFKNERDEGLFVALVETLDKLEKDKKLPINLKRK